AIRDDAAGRRLIRTVRYCSLCFQAEDGIRGRNVTGVQTCALPISKGLVAAQAFCASAARLAAALTSWGIAEPTLPSFLPVAGSTTAISAPPPSTQPPL